VQTLPLCFADSWELNNFAVVLTSIKLQFTAMTKLLLVRHGETVDNANRIMQGQTQGQLTAKGRSQARETAALMASERIDAFITSDLQRAVDTCLIIAKPHNAAIRTTPLLRERDWGGFTGRYIPDLKDAPWPDDIETVSAMKDRARRFLKLIRNDYNGQTVLAVGHGIINKAIQSVFYRKEMKDILPMTNAEVRTLLIPDY